MNVKTTKEMLTDFRKATTVIPYFFIDGVKIERVTEYKYLGIVSCMNVVSKMDDNSHVLAKWYEFIPSGRR